MPRWQSGTIRRAINYVHRKRHRCKDKSRRWQMDNQLTPFWQSNAGRHEQLEHAMKNKSQNVTPTTTDGCKAQRRAGELAANLCERIPTRTGPIARDKHAANLQ